MSFLRTQTLQTALGPSDPRPLQRMRVRPLQRIRAQGLSFVGALWRRDDLLGPGSAFRQRTRRPRPDSDGWFAEGSLTGVGNVVVCTHQSEVRLMLQRRPIGKAAIGKVNGLRIRKPEAIEQDLNTPARRPGPNPVMECPRIPAWSGYFERACMFRSTIFRVRTGSKDIQDHPIENQAEKRPCQAIFREWMVLRRADLGGWCSHPKRVDGHRSRWSPSGLEIGWHRALIGKCWSLELDRALLFGWEDPDEAQAHQYLESRSTMLLRCFTAL